MKYSRSFLEISKKALSRQLALWRDELPFVRPFYAVKCNNDAVLMRWMREINPHMGFDCASVREMHSALETQIRPADIIYAQPCKRREDCQAAMRLGVTKTVVDSSEEVEKLGAVGWRGDVLVRLLVDDMASRQPFGKKFGAPLAWLPSIYESAAKYGLQMSGFSFHVGSECQSPLQYNAAIERCWDGVDIGKRWGYRCSTIDIGGGFLPDAESFKKTASVIRRAAEEAPNVGITWIAEPGRFLAAPTHTLWTQVIGKKRVWPGHTEGPRWRITLDESIYSAFSNIPFDGQKPILEACGHDGPVQPTIVFGRTCDSGDCISDAAMLPEVKEGDWIRVQNMGAYTTVTASEFNGYETANRLYLNE